MCQSNNAYQRGRAAGGRGGVYGWIIRACSRGRWRVSGAVGSHSSCSDGCLIGRLLSALMGPESRHAASAAATFIQTLHRVDCTFLFSSGWGRFLRGWSVRKVSLSCCFSPPSFLKYTQIFTPHLSVFNFLSLSVKNMIWILLHLCVSCCFISVVNLHLCVCLCCVFEVILCLFAVHFILMFSLLVLFVYSCFCPFSFHFL